MTDYAKLIEEMPRRMRECQWMAGDAPFIMRWPDPLSSEQISDIEEYFAIWLRGRKRLAASPLAGGE
jgi:hypothetical protein